jgi:hypothetical protein
MSENRSFEQNLEIITQLIATGISDEDFHRIINETKLLEDTSVNETESEDITFEEFHHLVNEEKLLGQDITDDRVVADLASKRKTCNLDVPMETPAVTAEIMEAKSVSSVPLEVQIEFNLPEIDKKKGRLK